MIENRVMEHYSDPIEQKILKVDEELASTERAIQADFADFVEKPDGHQKKLLVELGRLHMSLRGPEMLLDKGSYSRPIPPPVQRGTQQNGGL
jgi:hypothetical protein